MKPFIISLLIALFLTGSVSAQQKWTLEQCIDHALKQNISLKMSELTKQNQEITLENARNQRLPSVYASGSQALSFGQSLNSQGYYEFGNSQTYSASLSASVNLFSGFQVNNTIEAQRFNLLASVEDLKKAQESMSVSIASAYLQVLYNKEIHQVAVEQEKLTQIQLNRYIDMAALGKIPEGQVSEIRAQFANDKLTTAQALSDLKLSLLDLSQMLELEKWSDFDVVVPSLEVEALSLQLVPAEEIYAYASTHKPAIKASEMRLKSSEKELKVAEGGYYPSLSLGANYDNGFYGGSTSLADQLETNSRTSVGVSLSIPIFSQFDTRNSVRSAKLNIKNAELEVENSKKTLYKEIQQAWFNATTALEKYYASKEAVTQSDIAFKFAEEKFNNGRSTAYEYYEARMNVASALSNLLQAKYNYVFCIKIVDFYKGEPLAL